MYKNTLSHKLLSICNFLIRDFKGKSSSSSSSSGVVVIDY